MRNFFTEMFRYDKWGNDRIISTLNQGKFEDERSDELISHVISAQEVWLSRIQNIPFDTSNAWKIYETAMLQEYANEMHDKWVSFISGYPVETFTEVIDYKNAKGDKFESVLGDIIMHVVNHGTHHRAQIAARLSEKGHRTPPLDYIFYKRMT